MGKMSLVGTEEITEVAGLNLSSKSGSMFSAFLFAL